MHKKICGLLLCAALLCTLLAGCSGSQPVYKVAMVTDGGAVSDNHLNNTVWLALQALNEEYGVDYTYYRPASSDTAGFLEGVDTLTENGYDLILFPGSLFGEAFEEACARYPACTFITVDCNPETVPANGAAAVFDKSQAGFLAGYAAALELKNTRFGGVFGSDGPSARELLSGFAQGVDQARADQGVMVSDAAEDFVFLNDRTNYPLGQQTAATLFEQGVSCLLVSSDPTGLGALAEARTRRQAGDQAVWAVCSDADGHVTAQYDVENDLSAALTTALCDYEKAAYDLVSKLLEGDTSPLGRATVFDLTSGGVGLPEENPALSESTVKACAEAAEKIQSGAIVIANTIQ